MLISRELTGGVLSKEPVRHWNGIDIGVTRNADKQRDLFGH